ncbi:hypothetical protein SDJN02_27867, partial [Cucurbita argyrosperma subsp. argyrosperma]
MTVDRVRGPSTWYDVIELGMRMERYPTATATTAVSVSLQRRVVSASLRRHRLLRFLLLSNRNGEPVSGGFLLTSGYSTLRRQKKPYGILFPNDSDGERFSLFLRSTTAP